MQTQKAEDQPVSLEIPPESLSTARQMATLLSVVQCLRPYSGPADKPWDDESPGLDGGVASAAHATLINTFARIDSLLADASRWDLREVAASAALRETMVEHQRRLQAQIKGQANPSRPSPVSHGPDLDMP